MSEKFKIKSVGIDTSEMNQLLPEEFLNDFIYVHTSIRSGNDTSIRLGIPENASLITTIEFLDKSDIAIINHLRELGRDYIDMLLIDSKCKIEDYTDQINNLLLSGIVKEIGISNPESPKDIENFKTYISEISCISLEICPLNFQYDVIKYCNDNDIRILGFNPFGGRINYPRLIDSFSVPYLLSFISAYSDIVFLSGNNEINVLWSDEDYLLDLINRDYGKEFIMSQNVLKLPKDPKKTINTALIISDNLIIPYNSGNTVFSYSELSFSIGKVNLKATEESEKDDLTKMVYDYYLTSDCGPLDSKNPSDTLSLLRYRVLDLARVQYSELDKWNVISTKISGNVFVISAVRKIEEKQFFRKPKETTEQINYILYYDGSNFVFQNIKNAIQ